LKAAPRGEKKKKPPKKRGCVVGENPRKTSYVRKSRVLYENSYTKKKYTRARQATSRKRIPSSSLASQKGSILGVTNRLGGFPPLRGKHPFSKDNNPPRGRSIIRGEKKCVIPSQRVPHGEGGACFTHHSVDQLDWEEYFQGADKKEEYAKRISGKEKIRPFPSRLKRGALFRKEWSLRSRWGAERESGSSLSAT